MKSFNDNLNSLDRAVEEYTMFPSEEQKVLVENELRGLIRSTTDILSNPSGSDKELAFNVKNVLATGLKGLLDAYIGTTSSQKQYKEDDQKQEQLIQEQSDRLTKLEELIKSQAASVAQPVQQASQKKDPVKVTATPLATTIVVEKENGNKVTLPIQTVESGMVTV